VAVDAVIFDWGGTLTPWRTIDPRDEWGSLARAVDADRADELTEALVAAATDVWARSRDEHRSSTIEEICSLAGIAYDDEHWHGYRGYWEHATLLDPDAAPLMEQLRADGIGVGVLSNTVWPRAWHEEIFARDAVDHLIDGAVYTSEIAWTKPAPQAFQAAMEAVGVDDPAACVFVGDRLFDDIYGAHNAGMRAVHLPHSAIPTEQVGHTEGEPDAVIQRLADIPAVIAPWR
jgi:putative hydrolase of the HAD superfamily